MMNLVYDLSPDETDLGSPVLRRRLGKDAADYLTQFEAELRREHEDLGKPSEFAVEIHYSLGIERRAEAGDITLTAGPEGAATRVVEVAKDPSRTHPYRQKELVVQLNAALKGDRTVNQYDVQCVIEAYKVKKAFRVPLPGSGPGEPGPVQPRVRRMDGKPAPARSDVLLRRPRQSEAAPCACASPSVAHTHRLI
jgi:hypothetical protein